MDWWSKGKMHFEFWQKFPNFISLHSHPGQHCSFTPMTPHVCTLVFAVCVRGVVSLWLVCISPGVRVMSGSNNVLFYRVVLSVWLWFFEICWDFLDTPFFAAAPLQCLPLVTQCSLMGLCVVSALTFILPFLLLALVHITPLFSKILRWELRLFIRDISSSLMFVFSAINFTQHCFICVLQYIFWYIVFSFSSS